MDRREFLQSLAALGATVFINPEALAIAPPAQIEAAWAAAVASPASFFVGSGGALATTAGCDCPSSRRELYDLDFADGDAEELIELARSEWRIEGLLSNEYEQAMRAAGNDNPDDDWRAWLRAADDDTLSTVQTAVNDWLEDMGEEDYEYADLYGESSRGEALSFFRYEPETADLFNIVIVEGDRPGSSYFAAELRMDMNEANELAERHGLPIRFAAGEA